MSKKHNVAKEEKEDLRNYEKYQKLLVDDNFDWSDANVEDVSVDGVPLDGGYIEHLLDGR